MIEADSPPTVQKSHHCVGDPRRPRWVAPSAADCARERCSSLTTAVPKCRSAEVPGTHQGNNVPRNPPAPNREWVAGRRATGPLTRELVADGAAGRASRCARVRHLEARLPGIGRVSPTCPGLRAVGHRGRDETEHIVVGVEQVPDAADARHVLGGQRLDAAELDAPAHGLVDVLHPDDGRRPTRCARARARPACSAG